MLAKIPTRHTEVPSFWGQLCSWLQLAVNTDISAAMMLAQVTGFLLSSRDTWTESLTLGFHSCSGATPSLCGLSQKTGALFVSVLIDASASLSISMCRSLCLCLSFCLSLPHPLLCLPMQLSSSLSMEGKSQNLKKKIVTDYLVCD